jgi:type VI secretion system secreted protein VgrG
MFPPLFTLTLDNQPSELRVLEFKGTEAISQPYRFDLELVSERSDLALEELLHRQAFLGFDDREGGHTRSALQRRPRRLG